MTLGEDECSRAGICLFGRLAQHRPELERHEMVSQSAQKSTFFCVLSVQVEPICHIFFVFLHRLYNVTYGIGTRHTAIFALSPILFARRDSCRYQFSRKQCSFSTSRTTCMPLANLPRAVRICRKGILLNQAHGQL